MKDILLATSGILAMIISVVHGYLGETKVVQPVTGLPASAKRILQAIMFLSALYWFIGGALLAVAPFTFSADGRLIAGWGVGAVFASGVIANFWATRGRHFGWMLLAVATALAWAGA